MSLFRSAALVWAVLALGCAAKAPPADATGAESRSQEQALEAAKAEEAPGPTEAPPPPAEQAPEEPVVAEAPPAEPAPDTSEVKPEEAQATATSTGTAKTTGTTGTAKTGSATTTKTTTTPPKPPAGTGSETKTATEPAKPPAQAVAAVEPPSKKTERLWKAKCGSCHGQDGKAQTEKGRKQKISDMTVASWQAKRTNKQLFDATWNGVKTEKDGVKQEMDAYKDEISKEDTEALVQYIRWLAAPK
jgi:mono/diheme cytochrome c family protein